MKIFMTSSPGGSVWQDGTWKAASLDERNGFAELFREKCPENARCLLLSSDPEDLERDDETARFFAETLERTGLGRCLVEVCDSRNADTMPDRIREYDLLILAGGHVPTENHFFHQIELRERLHRYEGVVLGISAGTMNCADIVYAAPEEEGEAISPRYKRYLHGLGLTDISVFPHFQLMREAKLDGLRVYEDICLPDSRVRPFYALPDGSYFYKEAGCTRLYGEAWLLKDGISEKICRSGESMEVVDER